MAISRGIRSRSRTIQPLLHTAQARVGSFRCRGGLSGAGGEDPTGCSRGHPLLGGNLRLHGLESWVFDSHHIPLQPFGIFIPLPPFLAGMGIFLSFIIALQIAATFPPS